MVMIVLEELIKKVDSKIVNENLFSEIDKVENYYSEKILNTFKKYKVSETDFHGTTGYGYNDVGRDKIDMIFADILDCEKAIARSQFISGTHALTVTLFGLLRPGDTLLSISGLPYDTLDEVIGIKDNPSSLKSFGIKFDYIDLLNNDFDIEKITNYIKSKPVKVIEIQRSRGYSSRDAISVDKINKIVEVIKSINKDIIIMIDNCYCEMTSIKNPNCDILVGSLIKNLGGGIAPNGAYVAGRSDLVDLVAERLTVPGQGAEVGPSMDMNKKILQGLYMAPSVVAASLKTNVFASCLLSELGFSTNPKYNEEHSDIVLAITFNDPDKLIKYVEGIQEYSAIDNYVKPIPSDMPGYSDKIIMASGSFTSGSSIEISCDGPIREPFIAYMQGSITYQYGRIAVINAVRKVYEER
jgi:cystathionine beta-lyase family protein involved in aluminum resistance